MSDSEILGFTWDRALLPTDLPRRDLRRACFTLRRAIPEFVWGQLKVEDSPLSYPEVMTLASGFTVGGRNVHDVGEALALIRASKLLLESCEQRTFSLSKEYFCSLHKVASTSNQIGQGVFRGESLATQDSLPFIKLPAGQVYRPLSAGQGGGSLRLVFSNGLAHINSFPVFEKALIFFLFASLNMFFMSNNKRTSWLMMNGVLMSSGLDPIALKAEIMTEFKASMLSFYDTRDGSDLLNLLVKTHPDS